MSVIEQAAQVAQALGSIDARLDRLLASLDARERERVVRRRPQIASIGGTVSAAGVLDLQIYSVPAGALGWIVRVALQTTTTGDPSVRVELWLGRPVSTMLYVARTVLPGVVEPTPPGVAVYGPADICLRAVTTAGIVLSARAEIYLERIGE